MRHPYQMDDVMISMGAYAEYYYLRPGHYVFKVPEDLSDEMVAPVNCALAQVTYGLQRIGLRIGQFIVIQGREGWGYTPPPVARIWEQRRSSSSTASNRAYRWPLPLAPTT